jgi:hypothetical protein
VSEREYYEHLGKAHNLFPLGRRFSQPLSVKTEEKQMKEYLDEIGEVYNQQRHVNTRGIPDAGYCFFHDFWIEDQDRIW